MTMAAAPSLAYKLLLAAACFLISARAQSPSLRIVNANAEHDIRVDGPDQIGRVTIQWGNDSDETISHVSLICRIDDHLAYFSASGRADFLTRWTLSDANSLGPQTILAQSEPIDADVIAGQYRSAEFHVRFDPDTPMSHETCIVCRLLTSGFGTEHVLGEATANLVMYNSPTPQDPTRYGACPTFDSGSVVGDPHVKTADGRVVDIWLKPNEWHAMLSGPSFSIAGHVFSKPNNVTIQWFDGIAIVDVATLQTVFNATIPHNVDDGSIGTAADIHYFDASLDDRPLKASNTTYKSADGRLTVRASKLDSATRPGIKDDSFAISTPDFSMTIKNSRENKRSFFSTREEQYSMTHIDLAFTSVPHPQDFAGPLAELMFRNAITSKSDEALAWTSTANALAE